MSMVLSQDGQLRGGPREVHGDPQGPWQATTHSGSGLVYVGGFGTQDYDLWFGTKIPVLGEVVWLRVDEDRFVLLSNPPQPPLVETFGSGIHGRVVVWPGVDEVTVGPLFKAWPVQGDGHLPDMYPPPPGSVPPTQPTPSSGHWFWCSTLAFKAAASDSGKILIISFAYAVASRTVEGFGTGGNSDMGMAVCRVEDDNSISLIGFGARSWTEINGLNGCASFCLPRAVIWLSGDRFLWVSNEGGNPATLDSFHIVDISSGDPIATDPYIPPVLGENGTEYVRIDADRVLTVQRNVTFTGFANGDPWFGALGLSVLTVSGATVSEGPRTYTVRVDQIIGDPVVGFPNGHAWSTSDYPQADCIDFWVAGYVADIYTSTVMVFRVSRVRVVGTSVNILASIDLGQFQMSGNDPGVRSTQDEFILLGAEVGGPVKAWQFTFDGANIAKEDLGQVRTEDGMPGAQSWNYAAPQGSFEKDNYFLFVENGFEFFNDDVLVPGHPIGLWRLGARGTSEHRTGTGALYRRET